MLLPIAEQFNIVVCGLLSGLILGILYDLYRAIRGNNVAKIVMIIEDILFWILCGIVVFTFLLYSDYAVIGTYVYVLMFIGFVLYLKICSNFIFKIEIKFISKVYSFSRIVANNISYYFRLFFSKNKSCKK